VIIVIQSKLLTSPDKGFPASVVTDAILSATSKSVYDLKNIKVPLSGGESNITRPFRLHTIIQGMKRESFS